MTIRRFLGLLLLPACIIALGTLGYTVIESWSVFESLYMTVMTVTTVGFSEVHPLSTGGKAFTIVLMLGGIFTLFYAAGAIIRSIVSGEIQAAYGKQRMERNLAGMKDHLIVCGYGRMGRLVCKDFDSQSMRFVVSQALRNSNLRQQYGVIIVAIKKVTGRMLFNPPGEALLDAGDILIVLGSRPQLDQLEILASG